MRALVTGCSGFIGSHLITELETNGYEVIKADLKESPRVIHIDIMDQKSVEKVLDKFTPDVLINMAGQANVGLSWKKPQFTMELNTIGMINILEAVKTVKPSTKVIAIGSSDEYGDLRELGEDVSENIPVNPMTPYAISKYTQELFVKLYCRNFDLDVCLIRMFNLGGAGQANGFMISDFASGIAEIEAGMKSNLSVGNLESSRDYTHVKDACRAIRLLAEKGHSGELYNICSAKTYKAKDVLDKMISMSKKDIDVVVDPAKMRPSDTPVVCGNHDKLTEHTGWLPEIDIDTIIADALDYWRKTV